VASDGKTLERLWAPWRMEYIRAKQQGADEGCIFCDKPAERKDRENLLLYRGRLSAVFMNLYPYNNGHLMIAPYQHTASLEEVPPETLTEMMQLMQTSMKILRRTMSPQGFNVGLNQGEIAGAGIEDHIHFHLVPRWAGDTNFMPITGHAKVLVQGLLETYDLLKAEFDQLGE